MALVERVEQLVPVVCRGLGSLHAVALTSFCESEMQSVAVGPKSRLRRVPSSPLDLAVRARRR